jgi:RHS repeat-associated protein
VNGAASYVYDAVGDRTQKTSTIPGFPGGLTNYNANDQLSTDTYDNDGNTTASNGLGYVYDFENHVVQAGAGITMVYDGDGNRVSKTVAGVTTKYLVDPQSPTGYAQVVYETFSGSTSASHETSRIFVYGLERISQFRSYVLNSASHTQTSYYVYDGHGSTRALTDPSGNVTDTYDYDAFGNLIHSAATGIPPGGTTVSPTPNEFLFAGEQFDSDLGLYYNRARYLNTSTGRFWTMDNVEGRLQDPVSLHKYLYGEGNPVEAIDPSGNDITLAETLATLPTFQILAATAVIGIVGLCAAFTLALKGPGFCGNKNEPLTLYRGLGGRNPGQIKPDYFDEDGLSLYEQLLPRPGLKFRFPVEIDYFEPKTPGTRAAHIYFPPGLAVIGDIIYTPEFEVPTIGKGHWSLQFKGGISVQLIVEFLRYFLDQAQPL